MYIKLEGLERKELSKVMEAVTGFPGAFGLDIVVTIDVTCWRF